MSISLGQPCDEGLVLSKAATAPCRESSARWILLATILGSSMAFIDGTVVNVTLAKLQANLDATVLQVQWVMEAYSLLLAGFLLLGGSLGDRYGRRRLFLLGVAVFALASLWCGLAPNIAQLIAARALQGLGGALLVPGSLAIIGASFSEKSRGRAIGTWSAFTAITTAIGPVVGGWLIEQVSWRAVFFINLPLALIVVIISFFHVPESRDETERQKLDWAGAMLTVIGLGLLTYGLIESSRSGFASFTVIGTLAAGAVVLLLLVAFEARVSNPMIPAALFRSRNFSGANLLTFLLYGALGGALFFFPLNLIQVQGYSATAAGAALLPLTLILFFLSRWGGGLAERVGARTTLVIGPMIAAVMNAVTENRVGIASGINNAISRGAALLAIAAFGIVMLHIFNHSLDQHLSTLELSPTVRRSLDAQRVRLAGATLPDEVAPPMRVVIQQAINDSFVEGFRYVMFIGAGLAMASAISSFVLIDGKRNSP